MFKKRTIQQQNMLAKLCIHIFLIFFVIFTLIPFYWMIISSLKPAEDFYGKMQSIFPKKIIFDNFTRLFTNTNFVLWFKNSFIVCICSTLLGMIICSMAGFAFGIYNFKFKTFFFWLVLCSVAIPEIVTIIPVFKLMADIKLINTYSSLILPYAVSMFGIFMMKQYIESSLPRDLIDAARIDGLNEFSIYVSVCLPLVKPGLGVLGIYLWLNAWSGYFWPLIMLKTRDMLTVPLGLATLYADPWNLEYGMLMAGSLVSTLPIILLFVIAQDQFISGLTTGAVKG